MAVQSVTAEKYMSTNLVSLTPDMDILKAVEMLVENRISGAPVLDRRGNLVGILSEQDCLKVALSAGYHGDAVGTVTEYMQRDPRTVDIDTSIVEIASMFLQDGFRRYPVMKNNRLVGQINRHDVLRAVIGFQT
jgi:CBS domain-containing protein